MIKKKIIIDIILNFLASLIPVFILQFMILPLVSSNISGTEYGKILTIIGMINLFSGSMGSVLNNIKLINFKKYEELNIKGDFSVIFLFFLIINFIVILLGMLYYDSMTNLIEVLLILIVSILILISGYSIVEFRINLSYKKILINGICVTLGYGLGYIVFYYTKKWEWIYFFGSLFSVIFIWNNTTIFKEPFVKTNIYKETRNSTIILLFSGLLLGATVYIDRLLLYPVLGGVAVSIYYTSTLLGKTISLAIQPIASVLLSYLAQMKKFDIKKIVLIFFGVSSLGISGYFFVILISKPLLSIMYPQFVEEALKYIYITTLTSIVIIICNVLNPILLRFYKIKWQLSINFMYIIIYLITSLILVDKFNIMGFCIGALIASISKLLIILSVIFLNYKLEDGA